jgi:hypothetical protein
MKTIGSFLAFALFLAIISCNAQTTKQTATTSSSGQVEAYYFHFNARCITCRTVESQARADIESLYPELVKSGKVCFKAVNLDEAEGKTLGDKLGVNGQTLLLVKGEQMFNITNEGFMYAVSRPDKLKAVIKEKMDILLEKVVK